MLSITQLLLQWLMYEIPLIIFLFRLDTQKLFEVTQDGHLIWSLPLSIILVTLCLVIVMGPTTLAGIAVLILFVPAVRWITQQMILIRQKRIKMTDERIQIASSMLRGIKVTKLNSYEENYRQRISDARNKELMYLRQELRVWGLSLVLIVVSPIMASAVSFAFFVLIDEDNILTASASFTVLLLFSALRFPINLAGRLLGSKSFVFLMWHATTESHSNKISQFIQRRHRHIPQPNVLLDSWKEISAAISRRKMIKRFFPMTTRLF